MVAGKGSLGYYIATCSGAGGIPVSAIAGIAIRITLIVKSRMIFLQAYLRIAHKILDLDDNTAPNIAELEKNFRIYGGFLLHINYGIFYDRKLLFTRPIQIKLCLSLQTHYFLSR
jgi:hypothetical protein